MILLRFAGSLGRKQKMTIRYLREILCLRNLNPVTPAPSNGDFQKAMALVQFPIQP
jgi:hypothetical protein